MEHKGAVRVSSIFIFPFTKKPLLSVSFPKRVRDQVFFLPFAALKSTVNVRPLVLLELGSTKPAREYKPCL